MSAAVETVELVGEDGLRLVADVHGPAGGPPALLLIALCDALEDRPLVIGASMGGAGALVAQGTVERQLFRGLVLVDITPDIDMEGGKRNIALLAADPDGYASLDEAAEAIGSYRGGHGGTAARPGR